MNGGFKSLKVYQLAYRLAMEIFEISKKLYKQNMWRWWGIRWNFGMDWFCKWLWISGSRLTNSPIINY